MTAAVHAMCQGETMSIERIEVNKRLSEAVIHAGTVYLCGQVADDVKGDIKSQTREVLANIDKMLARSGTDKSKLLSATVYLKRIADYKAMNELWDVWTAPNAAPARTCLGGVQLFSDDALVEITVTAAR
jgi:enamine deaminase RidA (YjgF/YER057c/UK114 family)